MSQNEIAKTAKNLKLLQEQYGAAAKTNQPTFLFKDEDGAEVRLVTAYAYYLIEYLKQEGVNEN